LFCIRIGFDEQEVQILILKENEKITPGDLATATLDPFYTPVGYNFIGRVVNVLAEPCDGEGPIKPDDNYPIFKKVPSVLEREPVNEPLQTGVKIIDGPFTNFNGAIDEVNPEKGKVKVSVMIFGRPTPIELEYWQIEKL